MPTNEELIRSHLSGVVLHRQRALDPFGQPLDEDDPLVNVLLSITRPAPEQRKKLRVEPLPEPAPQERIELPKGMVSYRRERWGRG